MSSLPFSCFLSIFFAVISCQRILDFTADSFSYPIGVRYLGCDVDESTDTLWCLGGWTANGDVYRYTNDAGWVQETFGIDFEVRYIFNAEIVNGIMYFTRNEGVELVSYDLTSGTFTDLGAVSVGAFAEVAAVNGNILYITCGGAASVVLYDISTSSFIGTWSTQSTHQLGTAKVYQDTLYLLGGRSTTTNKLEYTDLTSVNFITSSQADNVPDNLDYLTSVVTPEGYMYAIGGEDNSGYRNEILLYIINLDRVRTIDVTFPVAVYGPDCVIFMNSIWCMGGSSTSGFVTDVYVSNDLSPGGKGKGI